MKCSQNSNLSVNKRITDLVFRWMSDKNKNSGLFNFIEI